MYLTSCYEQADISWTPDGKQVDLSAPSGSHRSLSDRKHGCTLIGRKGVRLHETKTQCYQDLMPANTVKSLSCQKWLLYGFHRNSLATHPVPLCLFSTSQWRTAGAQIWRLRVPAELSLMDRQSGFSLLLWNSIVGSISKGLSCYAFKITPGMWKITANVNF